MNDFSLEERPKREASGLHQATDTGEVETSHLSTPFSSVPERHVLIVDWNEGHHSPVIRLLQKNSIKATFAERPSEVLRQIRLQTPSLILISTDLLRENAPKVFADVRSVSDAPIIVWADELDDWDCALMLNLGADDYIEKKANPRILVARLRAALRRVEMTASHIRRLTPPPLGRFVLRPGSNEVLYSGTAIPLSSIDFILFQRLYESMGKVVSREHLLQAINQPMTESKNHALGMRIHRIRRQCEEAGAPSTAIRCVRNSGYALTGN